LNDAHETLNPLGTFQYTVWKDVKYHEEMHYEQFNRRMIAGVYQVQKNLQPLGSDLDPKISPDFFKVYNLVISCGL
jgi:hypothetical protein